MVGSLKAGSLKAGSLKAGSLMADDGRGALRDRARAWFETLRDRICSALEALEDGCAGPDRKLAPG
ncbi:MAG: hypothetical protein ACREH3_20115, partial [Geminicoccales bacterium]